MLRFQNWKSFLRGPRFIGRRTNNSRRLRLEALEDRTLPSTLPVMLADINQNTASSNPSNFIAVSGTTYFSADDGVHGVELWKTDGTAAGTVETFFPSHQIARLTDVNGTLFFTADDGIHGIELWKSDGTAAGTVMVKDINPGSGDSIPQDLTNVNGTLFFTANDGSNQGELWQSDGTAAGTVMVMSFPGNAGSEPQGLTNFNGTLFFQANDGVNGSE